MNSMTSSGRSSIVKGVFLMNVIVRTLAFLGQFGCFLKNKVSTDSSVCKHLFLFDSGCQSSQSVWPTFNLHKAHLKRQKLATPLSDWLTQRWKDFIDAKKSQVNYCNFKNQYYVLSCICMFNVIVIDIIDAAKI